MIGPDAINEMLANLWPEANVACLELSPSEALASSAPASADIRPGGFISGPTQFAIADSACWFLVSGALGRVEPMALTSELSIRFLRPAKGPRLFARARLERIGRRNAVATIHLWTDDESRPCATAQATYALPFDG